MISTLLGHLAQFASFSTQGEVLCTQGLACLLQDPQAKQALAAEITRHTGVVFDGELSWYAEAYQECDRGRPDLEGRTAEGVPVVKVEAKLSANLNPRQFFSYVTDLQERSSQGVLVVLVPRARIPEATAAVSEGLALSSPGPWPPTEERRVTAMVISWDELLAALRRDGSTSFCYELDQLQDMYKVLSGYHVMPLAGPEELRAWREQERTFLTLVDLVTRRLTTHHPIYPMGLEVVEQDPEGLEPKGFRRRYVCRCLGELHPCFAIGVRDPFAGYETPLWLRFGRTTAHSSLIRERLVSSPLAPRLVESGGDVWVPLKVPLQSDGEQMVGAVVEQAEEIARVAYRPLV